MLTEWSAECLPESPAIVLPWSDAESGLHFVDLRAEPYDIAEIQEAELFPALGRALRSLNANRSPVVTSKCDAWPLVLPQDGEKLEALQIEMDLDPSEAQFGFASYLDLLWRERQVFASAHQTGDRLDRLMRRAARLPHTEASVECILRPAFFDQDTALEGFGVTLYVTAVAGDPDTARTRWAAALDDVVSLLRSRDLEVPRGSATIDAAR